MPLSDRVQRVKPSPTLAVTALAARLRSEGKDIIGLGAGEPDFDTPDHIKSSAKDAITDGFTKYTAVDGTPSLKQAVINKFKRENGVGYEMNQVMVSTGGKQVFYNLCQALLNPGDEVIIPAPYWVSYPDIVMLADATPVIVSAGIEQEFKITPEQLEAAITPNTKLFVHNTPSNPTSVMYTADELAALGEVLEHHPHVIVATDDIYEHILLGDIPFSNLLMANPNLYDRTVMMNGVSKGYSMTGWRIGYAGGPPKLIGAMKKVQSQSTSNPTSIAQVAAETALNGDRECIDIMNESFRERNHFVVESLNNIPGVHCLLSQGAFYAFANVEGVINRMDDISNDTELSEMLLSEAEVAVVPGAAFGAEGYIRLSFATSMENLKTALERITNALGE
ncbi:MAG: pyridoxal phosphate-dependent aminotransferase [Gammaproteobacteria bacterium]|uniref:Aminotransferase n=1 Tax=Candidatus Thiopontia autotrophica TaxID=2841688 RepID=A0A8J6TNK6_9GAMM|nr:pyridoxal phosphate-dependent aminotransferase [Candidatus Thiopontia autotrophica]MBL6969082.1 pyridoxal phosphate-dependent aminotransferase [Gammaproteobacteria bacterium]